MKPRSLENSSLAKKLHSHPVLELANSPSIMTRLKEKRQLPEKPFFPGSILTVAAIGGARATCRCRRYHGRIGELHPMLANSFFRQKGGRICLKPLTQPTTDPLTHGKVDRFESAARSGIVQVGQV